MVRWERKRRKKESLGRGRLAVLEVRKGVSGGNLSVGLALVEIFRIGITLTRVSRLARVVLSYVLCVCIVW